MSNWEARSAGQLQTEMLVDLDEPLTAVGCLLSVRWHLGGLKHTIHAEATRSRPFIAKCPARAQEQRSSLGKLLQDSQAGSKESLR